MEFKKRHQEVPETNESAKPKPGFDPENPLGPRPPKPDATFAEQAPEEPDATPVPITDPEAPSDSEPEVVATVPVVSPIPETPELTLETVSTAVEGVLIAPEGSSKAAEEDPVPTIEEDDAYADETDIPETVTAAEQVFHPLTEQREQFELPACRVILGTDHTGEDIARKIAASASDEHSLRIEREVDALKLLDAAVHFPSLIREGNPTNELPYLDRVAPRTQRVLTREYLSSLPILTRVTITEQLLVAVYEAHQRGVLVYDWADVNLAWDEEKECLVHFDLSSAILTGHDRFSEQCPSEVLDVSGALVSIPSSPGLHAQARFQTHRMLNDSNSPWTELKDRDRAGVVAGYILGLQIYGAAGWNFLVQTSTDLEAELERTDLVPAQRTAIYTRFAKLMQIIQKMSNPLQSIYSSSEEMLKELGTEEAVMLLSDEAEQEKVANLAAIPGLVSDLRGSYLQLETIQTAAQKLQEFLEQEDESVDCVIAQALFEEAPGRYLFFLAPSRLRKQYPDVNMPETERALSDCLRDLYSAARESMLAGINIEEWETLWSHYFMRLTEVNSCRLTVGQESQEVAVIMRMMEDGITLPDGSFFNTLLRYSNIVPDKFLAKHVFNDPDRICMLLDPTPLSERQYKDLRSQMKFSSPDPFTTTYGGDGSGGRYVDYGWDEGLQKKVPIVIPEETPRAQRTSYASGKWEVGLVLRLLRNRFESPEHIFGSPEQRRNTVSLGVISVDQLRKIHNRRLLRQNIVFLSNRAIAHLRKVQDRYRTPASLSSSERSYGTQEFVMIERFLLEEERREKELIKSMPDVIIEAVSRHDFEQVELIELLNRLLPYRDTSSLGIIDQLCEREEYAAAIAIVEHLPSGPEKAAAMTHVLNVLDKAGDGPIKKFHLSRQTHADQRASERKFWNRWVCRFRGERHLDGPLWNHFFRLESQLGLLLLKITETGYAEHLKIYAEPLAVLRELYSRERKLLGFKYPLMENLREFFEGLDRDAQSKG